MNAVVAMAPAPMAQAQLSFDRTVDRHLVHRSAVAEVFLTDVCDMGAGRVLLAAQLPTCHAYFGDHPDHPDTVDPLLIMEVARQATLATAHTLDVPAGMILISGDFAFDMVTPGWPQPRDAGHLVVDSVFTWTRVRRGVPRAGVCEQTIYRNGEVAARHRSSGQLLTRGELEVLRSGTRGTPPPWTGELVDRPDPASLAPVLVGREDSRNVVLAALERADGVVRARIAPRWSNRSLLDHSYDHLTMQILTEGARQLATTELNRAGGSAAAWGLTGVSGLFGRFAELDSPVTVQTASLEADASGEAQVVFTTRFLQDGADIAQVDLTFAATGADR